jgi:hypothetical protein
VCAVVLSSSGRRSVHEPATLHGVGSLVSFNCTTHVLLQASSVKPEVRLPHSDNVHLPHSDLCHPRFAGCRNGWMQIWKTQLLIHPSVNTNVEKKMKALESRFVCMRGRLHTQITWNPDALRICHTCMHHMNASLRNDRMSQFNLCQTGFQVSRRETAKTTFQNWTKLINAHKHDLITSCSSVPF